MTRLRPTGSFSSRKPSPCMNSVGGVDRSTSNTNPGRGLTPPPRSVCRTTGYGTSFCTQNAMCSPVLLTSHVERDLHRTAGPRMGRVVERLAVAVEGVRGRHEPAQVEVADELEGEVERAPLVP